MEHNCIDLESTAAFSPFFLAYLNKNEALLPFYNRVPQLESFGAQMEEKIFSKEKRATLFQVLNEQYKGLATTEQVKENITSLKSDSTYTITTGHQLNIFTGPLYFIYKIVTVINTCKALKAQYPDRHFVPVYWMASEDHDFEEINHFFLGEEKFVWNTEQKGAVGRFSVNGLKELSEKIPGNASVFYDAYHENNNLADAVRAYVNALFAKEGVVVMDADDAQLKRALIPVIKEDLTAHTPYNKTVDTSSQLQSLGYKTQVSAREINFFYLEDNLRERIVKEEGLFKVLTTDLTFTEDKMMALAETNPEKFSPNVILRPLYQELILPNLAYAGGPAEVVYWLQLKGVFELFDCPFPILLPRNFAVVVPHFVNRKIGKTGLPVAAFFQNENVLIKDFLIADDAIDIQLEEEKAMLENLFEKVQNRAAAIDGSMQQFVLSVKARMNKELDNIESKLLRAEKKRNKTKVNQILSVKEALFPGGTLQERKENVLKFYSEDAHFIQSLLDNFDPFSFKFNVLTYSNE